MAVAPGRRESPHALRSLHALWTRAVDPDSTGWIFTTGQGTPFSPRNVNRAWDKAIERAGVPRIRLHDARHTVVSLLPASGQDRYSVARHAGHAVTMMEGRHTHILPKQAQAVADMMTRLLGPSPHLNKRDGP
ncbi:MAG: tyrosine-type recombinase/integrase [Myxococcaceae bacterium]